MPILTFPLLIERAQHLFNATKSDQGQTSARHFSAALVQTGIVLTHIKWSLHAIWLLPSNL